MEITMVFARLLQKFEFKLLNDEKVDPVTDGYGITVKPENIKIAVYKI